MSQQQADLLKVKEAPTTKRPFGAYPTYKASGVKWLGDIPAHWDVRRLRWIGDFMGGGTPSKSDHAYWNGSIPWVSPKDMKVFHLQNTEDHITEQALVESATSLVPSGSVLIVVRSGILRHSLPVAINARSVALNQDMKAIVPFSGIDSSYLAYWIQANEQPLLTEWRKEGTTVESLETELIKQTWLSVPPISEQRSIGTYLREETAKINGLITKKERLIELLDEKRTALITQGVTKGLDPDVPLKDSGVEWMGEIPEHWTARALYTGYSVQLGKMLDETQISGEHLAPYLRNVDVQWDRINTEDLPEMDFTPTDRVKYNLESGDVLVCEGGEIGRSAIWIGQLPECYYQKALHRLRPLNKEVSYPRFMYYLMRAATSMGAFRAEANKSTIEHLTAVQLRHHRFPFPPPKEQAQIAEYLDRRIGHLRQISATATRVIRVLREYRSALITAAVTGKIDVRDQAA